MPGEALYTVVLEEYFNYFLPLDGQSLPTDPRRRATMQGSRPQSSLPHHHPSPGGYHSNSYHPSPGSVHSPVPAIHRSVKGLQGAFRNHKGVPLIIRADYSGIEFQCRHWGDRSHSASLSLILKDCDNSFPCSVFYTCYCISQRCGLHTKCHMVLFRFL